MARDIPADTVDTASRPRSARSRAVVLGAGFGGMAAALRLAALGYRVTLVERAPQPGGRALRLVQDGYRFDAGPSALMAPWLVDELFALFGERMEDHVTLDRPSPAFRHLFADGSALDDGPRRADTEAGIARLAPGDLAGFRRFSARADAIREAAFDRLAAEPFHDPRRLLAHAPAMARLRCDRSVAGMAAAHVRDPRLRQALSIGPVLIGGAPRRTTALYAMIRSLGETGGVWSVRGGMGALVEALSRLMARHGVETRLGTEAAAVEAPRGRVSAVRLADGARLPAEVVVSNVDPETLYGRLLEGPSPTAHIARRQARARRSMGAFVLCLGTDRQWPETAQHTVLHGADPDTFFRGVAAGAEPGEDASIYLHRATAADPEAAPPGGEALYALCPVPNLDAGIDWGAAGGPLRDRLVARLEARALPGLAASVRTEAVLTPEDARDRFAAPGGAAFSLAPDFTQSAWFRYHNRGEGVAGLYLVGAGTHPGAGIPGVLSSAKIVAGLVPAPEAAA